MMKKPIGIVCNSFREYKEFVHNNPRHYNTIITPTYDVGFKIGTAFYRSLVFVDANNDPSKQSCASWYFKDFIYLTSIRDEYRSYLETRLR